MPAKQKRISKRKQKYLDYLDSDKWIKLKVDLITIRGEKCEYCGRRKGTQVHHVTYDNLFNEEPDDVVLLCGTCHQLEHGIKRKKKRIVRVYDDGMNSKQRKKAKNKAKRRERRKKRREEKELRETAKKDGNQPKAVFV